MRNIFRVTQRGARGPAGRSAYELAVDAGFGGTEAEWRDSLNGADGTMSPASSAATIAGEGADTAVTPEADKAALDARATTGSEARAGTSDSKFLTPKSFKDSGLLATTELRGFIRYKRLEYQANLNNLAAGRSPIEPAEMAGAILPCQGDDGEYARLDVAIGSNFYWADDLYETLPDLLTAVGGGSESGGKIVLGPYVDPNAPNQMPDGTFSGPSTAGWNGFNGGVPSPAPVAGELEMQWTGAISPKIVSRALALPPSRAWRVRSKIRIGTSTAAVALSVSSVAATLGIQNSAGVSGAGQQERTLYANSEAGTLHAGYRVTSASASGMSYADDMEVMEARPFATFPAGDVSEVIDILSGPALPATTQVIRAADVGARTDGWWVEWRASGDVYLLVKNHNTQAGTVGSELNLGPLAPAGVAATVAYKVKSNDVGGSLSGSVFKKDIAAIAPGVSHLRDGQSSSGEAFTGTVVRRATMRRGQDDLWHQHMAAPAISAVAHGDSGVKGHTGVDAIALLAAALGAPVIAAAEGGSITDWQADFYRDRPYLWGRFLYHNDWGYGGVVSAQWYLEKIVAMHEVNRRGDLYSPPGIVPPVEGIRSFAEAEAGRVLVAEILDLMTAGGLRVFDQHPILAAQAISDPGNPDYQADQDAIAAGFLPPSIFDPDIVHLNLATSTVLNTARATAITAVRATL